MSITKLAKYSDQVQDQPHVQPTTVGLVEYPRAAERARKMAEISIHLLVRSMLVQSPALQTLVVSMTDGIRMTPSRDISYSRVSLSAVLRWQR